VEGVGDVTGGVDVRVGGAQLRIDPDAVVDLQAGLHGELSGRGDADPDDDRIGLDVAAVGQLHAARPAVAAGDLGYLDAAAQVDRVVAVQVGEDLRGLPAEHPQQRQLPPLQHGHLLGVPRRRHSKVSQSSPTSRRASNGTPPCGTAAG